MRSTNSNQRTADRDDAGFTLIELMVVVLIIAILIAVAVPTFLGARERAQDSSAQSNLRNALTAAAVISADQGDYAGTLAEYEDTEPSIDFVAGGTVALPGNQVSQLLDVSSTRITMAAASESGDCFFIRRESGNSVATNYLSFAEWGQAAGQACRADNSTGLVWNPDGW